MRCEVKLFAGTASATVAGNLHREVTLISGGREESSNVPVSVLKGELETLRGEKAVCCTCSALMKMISSIHHQHVPSS